MNDALNFTEIKKHLVAKGFKQLGTPYCNQFMRISPRSWWAVIWPFNDRVIEVVIIGNLVWFYEKAEVRWATTNTKLKTWGRNQQSLDGLLETLCNVQFCEWRMSK